ncbi:MAG: ROK family protein [Candidatus Omnitrophica bacterium]|nr:ROK family protein [Candidatus Omnitrophota bacterium]MDD5238165.1 ROK family protein [Candidatus Omnitrophota bacterium]
MSKKFIIAVDLGGTNLKLGLLNLDFKIIHKEVLRTRKFFRKESLISAIVTCVNTILEARGLKRSDILGIGLGLPGPVDEKNGIVHFFPNIPGWKEVRLKKILSKRLRLPIFLDNDANLMTLAEYKLGAARGFKNSLCITLGTGVGGGLIINGSLYRGSSNAAGEIGHVPINEEGARCNCGARGCLEAYIGNSRIIQEARRLFRRDISLEELSLLAKRHNRLALNTWSKVARRLGLALCGVVNLLNLDAIIIGGGVANAGEVLLDRVKKAINEQAMSVQAKQVKIFKAKLGNDAGLIGAAILVKLNS